MNHSSLITVAPTPIGMDRMDELCSYEDVMKLISEAKQVSTSIEQSLTDLKKQFAWDSDVDSDCCYKCKRVRFADDHRIHPMDRPSPELAQLLYVSEEEQQQFQQQLDDDLEDFVEGVRVDGQDFTSRGLERRTPQGQAERIAWRKTVRAAVLEEQDRQWGLLPVDQPCDEAAIALISLELTQPARLLARRRGLLDQEEASDEEETDEEPEVDEPIRKTNRKGHCVDWPTVESQFHQVFYYPHVETEEEQTSLWYPYDSLEDVKKTLANEIRYLSQGQRVESEDLVQETLRGLENRTPLAEEVYQKRKLELDMLLQAPEFVDQPDLLARQCQRLTARSQREARNRALMDQRVVKAYLYQEKKQARTPVVGPILPKKAVSGQRTPRSSLASRLSLQHKELHLIGLEECLEEQVSFLVKLRRSSSRTVSTVASTVMEDLDDDPLASLHW